MKLSHVRIISTADLTNGSREILAELSRKHDGVEGYLDPILEWVLINAEAFKEKSPNHYVADLYDINLDPKDTRAVLSSIVTHLERALIKVRELHGVRSAKIHVYLTYEP